MHRNFSQGPFSPLRNNSDVCMPRLHLRKRNKKKRVSSKLSSFTDLTPMCVVNDDKVDLSFTASAQPSSQAKAACEMQISLYAYWRVVQRRICDVIPMTLRYHPSSPSLSPSFFVYSSN